MSRPTTARGSRMKRIGLGLAAALFLYASASVGECVCRCVNGEVKQLCRSSIDVPAVCGPQVCPIVPPRVEPISPPRVPPIGTSGCKMEQVLNPATRQYEWKQVCR